MWKYLYLGVIVGFSAISCSEKPNLTQTPELQESAVSESAEPELQKLPELVSFNEHVQPILSANCYHCHGPDSGTRMPESEPLRVDKADGVFSPRESGKPVIVKGAPDASFLLQLMETDDLNKVMPPDPSKSPHGKKMDPQDIALVRKWIAQGAVFEDHWAYIAPKKEPLPQTKNPDWSRTPVDHFIAAKMDAAGVSPNPEQSRARLLRRLHFDLTGLPPQAEDLEKLLQDKRDFDLIYSELVDRLLGTQEYAEHFSRQWLDVARYADTHGIHIDNYRSIWPYRDWVLNAFKNNMPFDQFTREQISGDMLANATSAEKVATGYLRCLPTTGEGGSIPEEVRAMNMQDMTDTVASTWLGLSTGCAACHDHKFDEISTKENYQLTAFFNNTPMNPLDGNNEKHPPNVFLPNKENEKAYNELIAKINQLTLQSEEYQKRSNGNFLKWLNASAQSEMLKISGKISPFSLPLDDKASGLKIQGSNTVAKPLHPLQWTNGPSGKAAEFNDNNSINLGQTGDYDHNQAFGFSFWIKPPKTKSASIISKMDVQNKHRGYNFYIEDRQLVIHISNETPKRALKARTNTQLDTDSWTHVIVSYNGSGQRNGLKIFINGEAQRLKTLINSLKDSKERSIKNKAPFLIGARHDGYDFNGGALLNLVIHEKHITNDDAFAISLDQMLKHRGDHHKLGDKPMEAAQAYYFESIDPKSKATYAEIAQLNKSKVDLQKHGHYSLVMQEKSNSAPSAQILIRGQYNVKDEEILSAGTPASLPPMTDTMPKNRLGLGIWLTDPANPLPARVTVNRYWGYIFGRGIVESVGDFGVMGTRPTHPKLLDWLTVDFVENGWDIQHLIRTIVNSSTYRQSAVLSAEKMANDPDNNYFSRGPRYRLDAEQIRDLALSASGLLRKQLGGPSVKPYQPEKIWESVAMPTSNTRFYKRDSGDKLYRRSMYTFWKRTAHHPTMDILNAPAREVTCVQRELTNTPLQAFVVMNDPQFIECSRQLADQAIQNGKTSSERANWIAQRLLSRSLAEDEIEIIEKTYQKAIARFSDKPDQAKKLVTVGDSKATTTELPELASWTLIASQILNMDETLNK